MKLITLLLIVLMSCNTNVDFKKTAEIDKSIESGTRKVTKVKIVFGDDPYYFADTVLFAPHFEKAVLGKEGWYKYFLVNEDIFRELNEFNRHLENDSNAYQERGFILISEFSDGTRTVREVAAKYAYNYFRNVYYLFEKHKSKGEVVDGRNIYLILQMLHPVYNFDKPLPSNAFQLSDFVKLRALQDTLNVPFVLYIRCEK